MRDVSYLGLNPFQSFRRRLVSGSAKSGAAMAALAIGGASVGAAAGASSNDVASSGPDLLFSLGARIGVEIQSAIGTDRAGYSIHFLDCASDSSDGIRSGLKAAFENHGFHFQEEAGEHSGRLGVVSIRNLDTGREAKVELYPESLSQLNLIETSGLSALHQAALLNQTARTGLFSLRAV